MIEPNEVYKTIKDIECFISDITVFSICIANKCNKLNKYPIYEIINDKSMQKDYLNRIYAAPFKDQSMIEYYSLPDLADNLVNQKRWYIIWRNDYYSRLQLKY